MTLSRISSCSQGGHSPIDPNLLTPQSTCLCFYCLDTAMSIKTFPFRFFINCTERMWPLFLMLRCCSQRRLNIHLHWVIHQKKATFMSIVRFISIFMLNKNKSHIMNFVHCISLTSQCKMITVIQFSMFKYSLGKSISY